MKNYPFLQYKEYMKSIKKDILYRIPLDFGFSCPNRNLDGSSGCTFCSENGARAVQNKLEITIEDQVKKAISFSRERYNAKHFIAYIQAYTADFNISAQKKYSQLLSDFNFDAVSFGTRPDSINDESLYFMKQLNKKIEVFVDLGIQTVHNKTLVRINRKHNWQDSYRAIHELSKNGIKSIIHLIVGLPGESKEDFIETAKIISKLPIHAIKFHNLHLIKNTILYEEYQKKSFTLLNEYEYGEILMEMLRYIPANIPIIRIITDTLDDELVLPKWEMSKGEFISYIIKQMNYREWKQGDLDNNNQYPIFKEQYSNEFKIFKSRYKKKYLLFDEGLKSSKRFFINPIKFILEKNISKEIKILDIGFGLGYNSYSLIFLNTLNQSYLDITALEMDRKILRLGYEFKNSEEWGNVLHSLYNSGYSSSKEIGYEVNLLLGDARYTITKLKENQYDFIFLDPFLPRFNSELWTVEFLIQIKEIMNESNSILIFKHPKLLILKSMLIAGLNIYKIIETKEIKVVNYIASKIDIIEIRLLLPNFDKVIQIKMEDIIAKSKRKELLKPYHDPHQVWSNKKIHENRERK